jgi:hypothetical protein
MHAPPIDVGWGGKRKLAGEVVCGWEMKAASSPRAAAVVEAGGGGVSHQS